LFLLSQVKASQKYLDLYPIILWNSNGKEHDLEKLAHYAERAWTMAGGK